MSNMISKQGLIPHYVTREGIIDAWYWWLKRHHTGLRSRRYARLSKLLRHYHPGLLRSGPCGAQAIAIYNTLCDGERCSHERISL